MMSVMLALVIYLVLMNGYHFTEVILKQDNANSDIDISWSISGLCTGAWQWETNVWSTCSLSKGKRCTLTSLYWNIFDANMIFLNVSVSVTKCAVLNSRNPKPDSCSDYFQLRDYVGYKNGQKTYAHVSNIPKDPVPTNTDSEFYRKTDTISIDNVTGKQGIILQFYTSDFCGQLQKIVVYYHKCPTFATSSLASFESKAAPDQQTGSITIEGKCAPNTVMKSQNRPVMTCNYDGSYSVSGECICIAGFTKEITQCKACDLDEYKPSVGNQPCTKCGTNSIATVDRLACDCRRKYFREIGKTMDSSAECYRPPDAPENLTVTANTVDYVMLSWERPPNQGSKPLGDYVIKCVDCPGKLNFKTNKLSYNLTGLDSFATYTFLIYNENEITKKTNKMFSAVVKFRTLPGGHSKSKKEYGLIIGVCLGGILFLIILIVLSFYIRRKRIVNKDCTKVSVPETRNRSTEDDAIAFSIRNDHHSNNMAAETKDQLNVADVSSNILETTGNDRISYRLNYDTTKVYENAQTGQDVRKQSIEYSDVYPENSDYYNVCNLDDKNQYQSLTLGHGQDVYQALT